MHMQCIRHFAPRTEEKAWEVFRRERRKLINGAYGYIVMHQGNLKRESFKIVTRCGAWNRFDELASRHTAFTDSLDLVNAAGGFWPSLDVSYPECKELADLYDAYQEHRGDHRRAHRYELRNRKAA